MREGEEEREALGRGYRKGKQSLRGGGGGGGGGRRKAGGSGGICFFHTSLRVGFVPSFPLLLLTVLVKN